MMPSPMPIAALLAGVAGIAAAVFLSGPPDLRFLVGMMSGLSLLAGAVGIAIETATRPAKIRPTKDRASNPRRQKGRIQ